jgi:carbon-monoxide dehydrogenase medium subunit
MYAFDIERPTTVAEAVNALKADEAQPLGGGQTLIPTLKARLAAPSKLVSLSATTHGQVASELADSYPALGYLASKIGDPAVRNRGTIGGSVANNDPAACYPAACLASGATITTNTRDIAADDFFLGMFETALEEDEIVIAVTFPVPQKADYQKFEQPASRFPLVGVFVAKHDDGVRVAVTGASESGVFRWTEAEEALSADFSASALEGLSVDADGMINDLHGDGAYRAHLIKVLTGRAVTAAR